MHSLPLPLRRGQNLFLGKKSMFKWLEENTPKLVLAPSFIAVMVFVYGFIAWTAWVSLTRSRLLPKYEIDGFIQYDRLFASPRWDTAFGNLFIFGILFIVIAMILAYCWLSCWIRTSEPKAHCAPSTCTPWPYR
jgi:ABC-type sugar transport system permease subunit